MTIGKRFQADTQISLQTENKHSVKLLHATEDPAYSNLPALGLIVEEAMDNGNEPILCQEGVGGTYFMLNTEGQKVAVFKPQDEEPYNLNNPKGFGPRRCSMGMKEGVLIGEAAVRECSAYLLDHQHFSGVPPTDLAICEHSSFYLTPDGEVQSNVHTNTQNEGKKKLGSFQKYKQSDGDTEDISPSLISKFPTNQVHKICVLDLRLVNTDRHGGNILFKSKKGGDGYVLIPIDHGYTLPSSLDEAWFVWHYWKQSKAPMSSEVRKYIRSLDADKDVELLKKTFIGSFREEHFQILRVSTMLLKKGEAADLTFFDLANIMCRTDLNVPSVLETLYHQAERQLQGIEDNQLLLKNLSFLLDYEIQKIKFLR